MYNIREREHKGPTNSMKPKVYYLEIIKHPYYQLDANHYCELNVPSTHLQYRWDHQDVLIKWGPSKKLQSRKDEINLRE